MRSAATAAPARPRPVAPRSGEQTLNQILTELDGFDPSIGVIVLSATNKPEVLDPTLLRPGRFDRHVAVQPPDTAGRSAILAVHTRDTPLADDVDLDRLASATSGMVGADLANVVNEGSLTAARRGHSVVTMHDLLDALERLVLGTDRFNYDRAYLEASIDVALGGRVAGEITFPEVTIGAEDDIRRVTALARNMVGRWDMSQAVGPIAVLERQDTGWPLDSIAPETRRLVDDEVRATVERAHGRVTELLRTHKDALHRLADALLVAETFDSDEAAAAAGLQSSAPPSYSHSMEGTP
jgi:cell division protease FtsH